MLPPDGQTDGETDGQEARGCQHLAGGGWGGCGQGGRLLRTTGWLTGLRAGGWGGPLKPSLQPRPLGSERPRPGAPAKLRPIGGAAGSFLSVAAPEEGVQRMAGVRG